MKSIKYIDEFRTAAGQPFPLLDPDVMVQKEARDAAKVKGQELFDQPLIMEPTFAEVMIWFVNNIPHDQGEDGKSPRKLTLEDNGNGYAVIKAFQHASNGTVILEDRVHKWLVGLNDIDGTIAFRGVTQAVVAERLDDLVNKEKAAQEG